MEAHVQGTSFCQRSVRQDLLIRGETDRGVARSSDDVVMADATQDVVSPGAIHGAGSPVADQRGQAPLSDVPMEDNVTFSSPPPETERARELCGL